MPKDTPLKTALKCFFITDLVSVFWNFLGKSWIKLSLLTVLKEPLCVYAIRISNDNMIFKFWKDDNFLEVFLLLKDESRNDFGDVSDENWGHGKREKT